MKQPARNYKRIVIKIGSSLLCSKDSALDCGFLNEITGQVATLIGDGKKVVIVSSGAIAMGMSVLKLHFRPKDLPTLQAAAAIGQNGLMQSYQRSFQDRQLHCAQLLLTHEDFKDRKRYLNAENTLLTLLRLKSIPIINENDTISTDEIKFGDNDRLSALVANLIHADILIILSDVDGLLDKNKKAISLIDEITPQIKALASPSYKKTCVGGMVTKIKAAEDVTGAGIPCVIANGHKKGVILNILIDPAKHGTLFLPKGSLNAKKRWIAFSAESKGKVVVDEGAKNALLNNKSLLSVGVVAVLGDFASGSTVSVLDTKNHEFAKGTVTVSSKKLDEIKAIRFEKEVIHRDNIVILP